MARAYALVLSAALAGCAFQPYEAKPLSPRQVLAEFDARRTDSQALREFMLERGTAPAQWPLRAWGLRELTLLALFYHPDIELARKRLEVARAGTVTAGQRPNPGIRASAGHHSRRADSQSPWTLGLNLDLPVVTADKREARLQRAEAGVDIAQIGIAQAAWTVRSRLRSVWLDHAAAVLNLELIRDELATRTELVALLRRRLEAGAASAAELAGEAIRLAEAQRALQHQDGVVEASRNALAAGVGVPARLFAGLEIRLPERDEVSAIEAPAAARQLALRNRLDVRRALLEYAAAEADLRLEVAKQYPDFSLQPGYAWDQGDRIWSLGIGLVLPTANRNEGPILEAKARRDLVAQDFLALQARVIGESEGALIALRRARGELAVATQIRDAAQQRYASARKRFDAGYIDRLEKAAAKLELAGARRAQLEAFVAAQRAQGALEDALQRPLDDSAALAAPDAG